MNPLHLLEDPLRGLLNFLHDSVHLSYGWAIIVLTLIVRCALLPLVIKQYKSMRSMQMVAPQLKELQAKHKGNRQKLNEELMAFYKDNQINPFASCLPLVAQLPVFFALYYVLKNFAKTATGSDLSFMWVIPNVAANFKFSAWAILLVGIYGLSQLLSTELSSTPNMPESQRRLMRIIPLFVVIFVFQFTVPAGLVLYWLTTNLWTAGQQLVMRHRIGLHMADPEELRRYQEKLGIAEKKGSRTPSRQEVAAVAAVAEVPPEEAPAEKPRRRRRPQRGSAAAEAAPVEAPEATSAPEPAEAPEAAAPEPPPDDAAAEAHVPEEAPEAAAAPQPKPKGGGGASNGARRQPRPKGTAKGSRPASSSRSKRKR